MEKKVGVKVIREGTEGHEVLSFISLIAITREKGKDDQKDKRRESLVREKQKERFIGTTIELFMTSLFGNQVLEKVLCRYTK